VSNILHAKLYVKCYSLQKKVQSVQLCALFNPNGILVNILTAAHAVTVFVCHL